MCTFLTEAIFLCSKTCGEEETADRQWYHVNKDRWIESLVLLQRLCKDLLYLRSNNLLLKFIWFRKVFANAAKNIKIKNIKNMQQNRACLLLGVQ